MSKCRVRVDHYYYWRGRQVQGERKAGWRQAFCPLKALIALPEGV
jgi:hypothetical protein